MIINILKKEINFYKIEDIFGAITIDNILNNRTIIKAIIKAI